MSDFLDRVASRAVGGEPTLAPRVPSLFEPVQRDAVMPVASDVEGHRSSSPVARPSDDPGRVMASEKSSRGDNHEASPSVRGESLRREAANPLERIPSTATRKDTSELSADARPILARVDPDVSVKSVEHRLRHEHVHRHVAEISRVVEEGALVAPHGTVFPSQPFAPDRRVPQRAHEMGDVSRAEHEPVVHVSIGRLEVRAGPAPTAPARRQETPRHSAFDDYLRERGKASP